MFEQFSRTVVIAGLCGFMAFAQSPDNTGTNKRDNKAGAVTAEKQGNSEADRKMLQAIRKSVVAEKGFSTYAQNVKIIVSGGVVTLRGPIKTENEKRKIEEFATLSGASKVHNHLEMTPESAK